jgi:GNAT superfamily N-acetyltransferase
MEQEEEAMKSELSLTFFRQMKQGEEAVVVDLVLSVFSEFVALQFSNEGIAEFKNFATKKALLDRLKSGSLFIVAQYEQEIIGMIEMRDNSHIALLFVKNTYQKKGIAKKLLQKAIAHCKNRNHHIKKITVNASPNAYDAYLHIGFKGEKTVKTVNGIQFIPMEFELGPG